MKNLLLSLSLVLVSVSAMHAQDFKSNKSSPPSEGNVIKLSDSIVVKLGTKPLHKFNDSQEFGLMPNAYNKKLDSYVGYFMPIVKLNGSGSPMPGTQKLDEGTSVETFTQPTAEEILSKAKTEALASNKNIMLIFHASWCGWCKKFDKGLDSSLVKPFFDANYVKVHFTVKESQSNKQLETLGGEKYLNEYGGANSGLPFWVILDAHGKLIGSSIVKGNNLGCPANKEEVDGFIQVLKNTLKNSQVNEQLIKDVFILK